MIHILSVEKSIKSIIPKPLKPPGRFNLWAQVWLHENCSRVGFPRATEVRVISAIHKAILEWETSILVRVFSTLCSDCYLLTRQRNPVVDVRVLNYNETVPKYYVDRAVNVTVAVELAKGVCVQSVLVPLDATPVKDWTIWVDAQCHSLATLWARSVAEGYIPRYESWPRGSCKRKGILEVWSLYIIGCIYNYYYIIFFCIATILGAFYFSRGYLIPIYTSSF